MLRLSWVIFNGLFLATTYANPRVITWAGEAVLTHTALHLLDRLTARLTARELIEEIDRVQQTIRSTDFARLCRIANGRVRDGAPNQLAYIAADLTALRAELENRGLGSASADLGRAAITLLGGPSDLGTVRLPSVTFAGSTWLDAVRIAVRYEAGALSRLGQSFCILPPPPPQQIRCECSTRCVDPNNIGDRDTRRWEWFKFDRVGNCRDSRQAQATQFCRAQLGVPTAYGETSFEECRQVIRWQEPNAVPHAGAQQQNTPAHR